MRTMISRLKAAKLDREKAWNREIFKKELAKAAGVSSSAVSQWWSKESTALEAKCVFGLAKFLQINAEWLQSGRGHMLQQDDDHISAGADKSRIDPNASLIGKSNRGRETSITEKKPPAYGNVEHAATGYSREIPVISYVQAGMMTEALDPFSLGEGFETITVNRPCSEHTFGLRIKGKSMLPRFEPDDVVVIDPNREPRPGQFVVAKNTEEEATFKKYKALGVNEYGDAVFELVPLNEDFATLHSERDHLRIVGVAIEHRKGLLE